MHRALGLCRWCRRCRRGWRDPRLHGSVHARLELTGMRLRMHAAEPRRAIRSITPASAKSRRPFMSNTTILRSAAALAHLERLVELLLVLDEQHAGARVPQRYAPGGRIGRVDAVADAAAGWRGRPASTRRAYWRGWRRTLARREARLIRPWAISRTASPVCAQVHSAPQPELLLAQEDRVAALRHAVPEQRRHRLAPPARSRCRASANRGPVSHRFGTPSPPGLLLLPAPLAAHAGFLHAEIELLMSSFRAGDRSCRPSRCGRSPARSRGRPRSAPCWRSAPPAGCVVPRSRLMRTTISKISARQARRQAEAGLVEQHQVGRGHQRARDGQHLLLAAREAGILRRAPRRMGK